MNWNDDRRAELLQRTRLDDLPVKAAIELLAEAIDDAWDRKEVTTLIHIAEILAPSIDRDAASSTELTDLDYFLANAWNGIKYLQSPDPPGGWAWESHATEQEIICLRRAAAINTESNESLGRLCQIHTNLGNCYSTTGRIVEAIHEWGRALAVAPAFGMARANRAIGLWTYARTLYDPEHAILLAREAWRQLDPQELHGLEPGSGEHFQRVRSEIEAAIPDRALQVPFDIDSFSLGNSDQEQAYRRWCLQHGCFVNPLIELGPHSVAAQDILTCPSVVVSIGEGPRFHDYMNQIKQEYCSARWLVYDAMQDHHPHFSDRDVRLYNTLDYPSYGLRTEQLKLAFRSLYSLFDKLAFFLNAYLSLGIPEQCVSARGLWYINQERRKGIRDEFVTRENWSLRGLYWLTKDLFEDTPGFREAMDPLAERLNDTRNRLEHKYLKLHSELWAGPESSGFNDSLAVSVSRREFQDMTLHLLRTTRAAIIYSILGVHREEQLRAEARGPNAITPPMPLGEWEDDWKS